MAPKVAKGSPEAYKKVVRLIREEFEDQLYKCEDWYGTDPTKVLDLLAENAFGEDDWEEDEEEEEEDYDNFKADHDSV